MKLILSLAAFFAVIFATFSAQACEKHINGHQSSSDTNAETIMN
jgi:hypothetical protein